MSAVRGKMSDWDNIRWYRMSEANFFPLGRNTQALLVQRAGKAALNDCSAPPQDAYRLHPIPIESFENGDVRKQYTLSRFAQTGQSRRHNTVPVEFHAEIQNGKYQCNTVVTYVRLQR